jgi:hypothetical protein
MTKSEDSDGMHVDHTDEMGQTSSAIVGNGQEQEQEQQQELDYDYADDNDWAQ